MKEIRIFKEVPSYHHWEEIETATALDLPKAKHPIRAWFELLVPKPVSLTAPRSWRFIDQIMQRKTKP